MQTSNIQRCGCRRCQRQPDHPGAVRHREINVLMSQLPEKARRLYAAIESRRMGKHGRRLFSEVTGICRSAICRGQKELTSILAGTVQNIQKHRPGRKPITQTYPEIGTVLESLIANDTAGDPMTSSKWVRVSCRTLNKRLAAIGYRMSYRTVWKLLKQLGYSMKVNEKVRALAGRSPKRDMQFRYMAALRKTFENRDEPVISVDGKKKELIGDFKVEGQTWRREAIKVGDYKYASLAECVATPYGIYDVRTNKGYVWVGTSGDTPAFAVTAIKRWWMYAGRHVYPTARNILILADGGGSNGYRSRGWKHKLQCDFCDEFGLTVTVAHFPTHCSKYYPIERRLFSQISMNWAGIPLTSLEVMLAYMRGTSTQKGLSVDAFLLEGVFTPGKRIAKEEIGTLALERAQTIPEWNYTIKPRLISEPSRNDIAVIEGGG